MSVEQPPDTASILATKEWQDWVHLQDGPSPGLAWNATALTSLLAQRCSENDVSMLLRFCRSHDPTEQSAAFFILLSLRLRKDSRLNPEATEALGVVAAEVASTDGPGTRSGSLALQTWLDISPNEADAFLDESSGYESAVALDTSVPLPVLGGGRVILGPGRVECRVRFVDLPLDMGVSDETTVLARLDVTDIDGQALRAHAFVTGDMLFELLRWSPVAWSEREGASVLPALRASLDYRDHIPVCAPTARVPEPVILWAKHLTVLVELRRNAETPRETIIVAKPEYGRLGGGACPQVGVAGDWAARLVLASPTLMFWPLDRPVIAPQPKVRLGGGMRSATFWSPRLLGWRTLAREELQAAWRAARPRDWTWRRVLQSIDPELLESLAVEREPTDESRQQAWSMVEVLDYLGTSRAIGRLEELARRTDFLGDHARQILARRGIGRTSRILELVARRTPPDLWQLREVIDREPRPTQEEIRGWLGDPAVINASRWTYEWPLGTNTGLLEMAWNDTGALQWANQNYRQPFQQASYPEPEKATYDEACVRFGLPVSVTAQVNGGGSLLLPHNVEIWGYVSFRAKDLDELLATIVLADREGQAYTTQRTLGPDELLGLLMQERTCLRQGVPTGTRLPGDLKPHWPQPTVLAGLVMDATPEPQYSESGFDVGGGILMEFWMAERTFWRVSCCLRNVARVDGERPCDAWAELPGLPCAIVAPWLSRLDPSRATAPTKWRRIERGLLPQADVIYQPA